MILDGNLAIYNIKSCLECKLIPQGINSYTFVHCTIKIVVTSNSHIFSSEFDTYNTDTKLHLYTSTVINNLAFKTVIVIHLYAASCIWLTNHFSYFYHFRLK